MDRVRLAEYSNLKINIKIIKYTVAVGSKQDLINRKESLPSTQDYNCLRVLLTNDETDYKDIVQTTVEELFKNSKENKE